MIHVPRWKILLTVIVSLISIDLLRADRARYAVAGVAQDQSAVMDALERHSSRS